MAWTNSKVFRAWLGDSVSRAVAYDLDTDAMFAALYNNTTTPDQNVASGVLTGYNGAASQWVVANEVISSTSGWPAGGIAMTSLAVNTATSAVVFFSAANTASSTSAATISGAFGALVYDSTLANKNGVSFNYLGGSNSVTNGTFTIVWNANGIWRATI